MNQNLKRLIDSYPDLLKEVPYHKKTFWPDFDNRDACIVFTRKNDGKIQILKNRYASCGYLSSEAEFNKQVIQTIALRKGYVRIWALACNLELK